MVTKNTALIAAGFLLCLQVFQFFLPLFHISLTSVIITAAVLSLHIVTFTTIYRNSNSTTKWILTTFILHVIAWLLFSTFFIITVFALVNDDSVPHPTLYTAVFLYSLVPLVIDIVLVSILVKYRKVLLANKKKEDKNAENLEVGKEPEVVQIPAPAYVETPYHK
ncbi:hypothetical protein HK099_004303 [Clydaea vesicula]|uniref:Uncharacterized protein n=1 Tax=Clydaea vesicula TaxID=447962 RepID=A0AAD5UBT0_9FUNG|nr:hypothetical protein HK099_004303 [Clydaea vesicula]